MAMLIEAERRRVDFAGGPAVKMADGNDWHLARPLADFITDDDEVGLKQCWNLGDGFGALFESHLAAQAQNDGVGMARAELRMAEFLLLRNYDLTKDEVRTLVRLGFGPNSEPGSLERRVAIRGLITGEDGGPPKPSGDGSG